MKSGARGTADDCIMFGPSFKLLEARSLAALASRNIDRLSLASRRR